MTVVSGQGSDTVVVAPNGIAGQVEVVAVNICGDGPGRTHAIQPAAAPSAAFAGSDRVICSLATTLEGSPPGAASGLWTILSGEGGVIDDPSDPRSTFTG